MSKYEKLGAYLSRQPGGEIPMTFAEIEQIVGGKLPPSSRYPAWWSNNPSNNVMTKIWLRAGFKTEQVSIESRKLVFRRVARAASPPPLHPPGIADVARTYTPEGKIMSTSASKEQTHPIHPAFGSMKGLITIMPGVDLTEPADGDWGRRLEKKYGKRGKPS